MENEGETTTSPLRRLLQQVQALAAEVYVIAERIHRETEEAHRLAAVARDELTRSRELSRSSHDQAYQVKGAIQRGLNSGQPPRR
jgi:hypothetical protein